jgi:hypothetical protein
MPAAPFTDSDILGEYSSALSLPLDTTLPERGRKGRTVVSFTRLLFDVLETFLSSEVGGIDAVPRLFDAFLLQNK